jgi:hypothetical protein
MTDNYAGLFDGAADATALVINAIADEAIEIGSPVIGVAAGTGEINPRVEPTTDGTLYVAGVVVGGDANGIWVDGTTANDGNAADAAGESVKVCTHGRCKVRVDGSTGGANSNIAIGDPLSCAGTDEIAQRAVSGDFVFGRALQTSTASTDAILCEVTLEGIL